MNTLIGERAMAPHLELATTGSATGTVVRLERPDPLAELHERLAALSAVSPDSYLLVVGHALDTAEHLLAAHAARTQRPAGRAS